MTHLEQLVERIISSSGRSADHGPYRVPARWRAPFGENAAVDNVNPWTYWGERILRIQESPRHASLSGERGSWTQRAIAYGLFVRAGVAFDHDGDGRLSPERSDGWRETGTFVKAIGLLPYFASLGCNTIHLLPIHPIGVDGRKGVLGSPYAITDYTAVDPMLSEPALGLGPDVEFAAFVEAAHRMGFRVIQEFALRTSARDARWIGEHPDWVYWIREQEEPGSTGAAPAFSSSQLRSIQRNVARKRLVDLPSPDEKYRDRFVHPSRFMAVALEGRKWVATTHDGQRAVVAGAFADWPPDDTQPLWTDVTYLRLFDDPAFDYVAYNTIRMYDSRLAVNANRVESLWEQLTEVIPSFQARFSIDGALLDMGHALPSALRQRIVARIRSVDPDAALWEESFASSQSSRQQGYNVVVGNYWWLAPRPDRLRRWLRDLTKTGMETPFLMTPETHDTPRAASRAGGRAFAEFSWALGCAMSGVPYVHGGFELGEMAPVNTGLDFEPGAERAHPEHHLPLYNPIAYDWRTRASLIPWIKQWIAWRKEHAETICRGDARSYRVLPARPRHIIAIERRGPEGAVVFVAHPPPPSGGTITVRARVRVGSSNRSWGLAHGEQRSEHRARIDLDLAPGECWVGERPQSDS